MRGGQVGKADEELLRGAWEWAGRMEHVHSCRVRVGLYPTHRLGVWQVRASAALVQDGRAVRELARYACEWPTSERSTVAGAIFAALVKLDACLGETAEQAAGVLSAE